MMWNSHISCEQYYDSLALFGPKSLRKPRIGIWKRHDGLHDVRLLVDGFVVLHRNFTRGEREVIPLCDNVCAQFKQKSYGMEENKYNIDAGAWACARGGRGRCVDWCVFDWSRCQALEIPTVIRIDIVMLDPRIIFELMEISIIRIVVTHGAAKDVST